MHTRTTVIAAASLLLSLSCLADDFGFTVKGDSMNALADGSGFSCMNCELTLRSNQALHFEADRIRSDKSTGTVQLDDHVSVKLTGGTLVMEHATLSTGSDGQQRLLSPELRFIPFGRR